MISRLIPGIYPGRLFPVGPNMSDFGLPGFQARFQAVMADAAVFWGPRDESWNLLGLEILPADVNPAVAVSPLGDKNCVLRISEDANEAGWLMDWQLSHEAVHLLSPPRIDVATIFEEGVASYNQHRIARDWHGRYHVGFKLHQKAFDLVKPLVEQNPNGVRNLRFANNLRLSPVTRDLLHQYFSNISNEQAEILAGKFYT